MTSTATITSASRITARASNPSWIFGPNDSSNSALIAGLAQGEILAVWEDDDIYLPHHISSHVTAMDGHLWSKPSKVLSDYTGRIQEEDATGRFHASLAFTRHAFEQVAGWPLTLRGDFDQQLIARLYELGLPGDPCSVASPSYIFRWGSTSAYHGQAFMQGPEDEGWYDRVRV